MQTLSSAALIGGAAPMGYTFTKFGALGFAEWAQLTYGDRGIKVTCLCPNLVNTGMIGRNEDDEAAGVPTRSPRVSATWSNLRSAPHRPLPPCARVASSCCPTRR